MSLLDNIKESEGFRNRVYRCTGKTTADNRNESEGYDTIGYGFAIKDLVMDEDIATMILERKVAELKLRVHNKFPFITDLPESVQDVVIEMCYQMGVYGFSCFKKTIAYLQDKKFKEASVEMLDSRWAEQTPNRAKELSDRVKKVDLK